MSYRTDDNGNYVRTVRCGHCYELGHNKSGCKARKTKLKDTIAEYERKLAEDDFDDDWDRRHIERWLENNKQQLEKMASRGKNRKCSYCTEVGHTRRTCKSKKGDMNDYATKTMAAREKYSERLAAAGLGVGTLLNLRSWRDNQPQLVMVENIRWDYLTHECALGEQRQNTELVESRGLVRTSYEARGERFTNMLPEDVIDINDHSGAHHRRTVKYEIVSPVDASFPADFLTIEAAQRAAKTRGIFEKERPYDYYGVEYDEDDE